MAVPLSKNQLVIHLLTHTCGKKLGRVRLAKALFLADYHSRMRFGKPITSYEYKYDHHGPWTRQIPEDVHALEVAGALKEHLYFPWSLRRPGHYYTVLDQEDYSRLNATEMFILQAVVDHCSSGDLEHLLKEVYSTPPMVTAQQVGRGVRIPMEEYGASAEEPQGITSEDLARAERELDAGLGEDVASVLNAL